MASDMYLIWSSGSPPCWRIMIALEEKKLQGYKQKLVSFEKGEHKSKEVLDINPRGQVPAFRHGDKIINESIAACMYLESQFKSQGTQLMPSAAAGQALVYQRSIEVLNLQQKMVAHILYNRVTPEGERHEGAVKRNKEALTAEYQMWEGLLQKTGPYLAGKDFSMADVIFFPSVAFSFRVGLSQAKYPKLAGYYAALKDRPSIKASWPQAWLQSPPSMDMLKDL